MKSQIQTMYESLIQLRGNLSNSDAESAYQEALRKFKNAVPTEAQDWWYQADIYREEKDWINAERCLQKVLELNPNHVRALCDLGLFSVEQGKCYAAVKIFSKALVLGRESSVLAARAKAYVERGEYVPAIEDLEEALELAAVDEKEKIQQELDKAKAKKTSQEKDNNERRLFLTKIEFNRERLTPPGLFLKIIIDTQSKLPPCSKWDLLCTGKVEDGYQGIAYKNKETKQVVIVHMLDAATNKLLATASREDVKQKLEEIISGHANSFVETVKGFRVSGDVFHAGHAFAGAIAEDCALRFGHGARTFNSVGCGELFSGASVSSRFDLIGYFSQPNRNNTLFEQIGCQVLMDVDVASEECSLKDMQHAFDMDGWSVPSNKIVTNWPAHDSLSRSLKLSPVYQKQISLRRLSPGAQEFLRDYVANPSAVLVKPVNREVLQGLRIEGDAGREKVIFCCPLWPREFKVYLEGFFPLVVDLKKVKGASPSSSSAQLSSPRSSVALVELVKTPNISIEKVRAHLRTLKDEEVNAINGDNRTALHWACVRGRVDIVRCLLDAGANVNLQDKDKKKPIYLLLEADVGEKTEKDIVQALLKKGAHASKAYQLARAQSKSYLIHDLLARCGDQKILSLWDMIINFGTPAPRMLDDVIKACRGKYKPPNTDNNKAINHQLFDEQVRQLLGIAVNYELKADLFRYLAHLRDMAGVISQDSHAGALEQKTVVIEGQAVPVVEPQWPRIPGEKLEGWSVKAFLAARFRVYLQMYIEIEKGHLNGLTVSSQFALEGIKKELLCLLRAFWAVEIRDQLKTVEEPHRSYFLQTHLSELSKTIGNLKVDEELCYPTGTFEHAIYVNFTRRSGDVLVRVDNLAQGYGEHNRIPDLDKLDKDKVRVWPRLVDKVQLKYFSESHPECLSYLTGISEAPSCKDPTDSRKKIYGEHFTAATRSSEKFKQKTWESRGEQTVGNCTAKNYSVGFFMRTLTEKGRLFFKWMKKQEQTSLVSIVNNASPRVETLRPH